MTDVTADRFFGVYRGKVHDVNDPEQRYRLRIIVPEVGGTKEPLDWALPCFASFGTYLTRGTPIWVMFEGGDPSKPVYLGSWRVGS